MAKPDKKLKALTEAFVQLGFTADESRAKAEYQLNDGSPELARMSFLKAAWAGVVAEENDAWIQRRIDTFKNAPEGVGNGAGRALIRLLKLGASKKDLTDLVRTMQFETLDEVLNVIDNSGDPYNDPLAPASHWHLTLVKKCPARKNDVGGLHESVLQTDPTGREMRPRPE